MLDFTGKRCIRTGDWSNDKEVYIFSHFGKSRAYTESNDSFQIDVAFVLNEEQGRMLEISPKDLKFLDK